MTGIGGKGGGGEDWKVLRLVSGVRWGSEGLARLKHTHTHTHTHTHRPTGQQANRPTGQQANRPTGQQATTKLVTETLRNVL